MQLEIDRARLATDGKYKDELRWRAQTDLLWLAKYVLGYHKIDDHDHRELADLFIKKDPRKPIELQDTVYKIRLALMPRGTYKTTFNIADTVQWIICFPEVAIMVMVASNTDEMPLGDAFVEEAATHFYNQQDAPEKKLLTILFPEFEIFDVPKKGKFVTPARKHYRRDPTLRAVSIEQSLSGWHPDIIKSEDVQDNRNSQTPYGLKKVRTNFGINTKMLAEWCYLDMTGTRYGPADLYSHQLRRKRIKILWKSAYVRKPHAMKKEEWELTQDDVILQFPRLLPWDHLVNCRTEDPASFWTQLMNIAEGNFKPTFPLDRLEGAKIPADDVPLHGTPFIAWRFETADTRNDAAAVGILDAGRMHIVEMFAGQMSPTARATRVVTLAKKWESHRVQIEDTPGARTMEQHIRNAAIENEWRTEIQWTEFLQDATVQSLYIKSAEPHLQNGRLLFSDDIPDLSQKFQLLYQYGMTDELELPSVVAHVAANLPASIAAADFDSADDDKWEEMRQKDAMDRVYNRGRYAEPERPPLDLAEIEAAINEAWEPQTDTMGLDDIMPGLNG